MNIGINGVLVLLHSFSFSLSASFSFSVFLHHFFHFFSFTQSRGYPYTQRVFVSTSTRYPTTSLREMTAGMSVCMRARVQAV